MMKVMFFSLLILLPILVDPSCQVDALPTYREEGIPNCVHNDADDTFDLYGEGFEAKMVRKLDGSVWTKDIKYTGPKGAIEFRKRLEELSHTASRRMRRPGEVNIFQQTAALRQEKRLEKALARLEELQKEPDWISKGQYHDNNGPIIMSHAARQLGEAIGLDNERMQSGRVGHH